MRASFDIIILGGGLNGAALALALSAGPHDVALLEPRPPDPPEDEAAWDSRIYAFSPGNVDWLRTLGAWDQTLRAQAVTQMRVRGDGDGALTFDALDAGLGELAWIAENGRLQWTLWQALQRTGRVRLCRQAAEAVTWGDGRHTLHLAGGDRLDARLLIAADGAHSWLRAQAGIEVDTEDYRHVGVVANFDCERPHRGIARQWFRADGVLAWLPLPGRRISMVWSTPPAEAEVLRALPAQELARRVGAAGDHALGELRVLTAAAGFPLKRRRARIWTRPGLVLIGDAAHTVHPLAGQGVNLGFRDSRLLAALLARGGDPGEPGRLAGYAARRMEDVASMQFTTGGLKKLFTRQDSLSRALRNWGMRQVDACDPLNQALTRHAIL
jgi:2-octaprenyl-6-methoxyphenol hydroxylase